ncbi:BMP family ABC transporter substrate-binding protein [uncultured Cetobacterium sp.]|uniref:BMP family lipoprotein n=1 Tax=uncultured Cetobacterium sp. TaxID=527638 RepID=UPI002621EC5A|nr:BMP family ABC transporter substrate-binding protein [uncultured Cetobacterium sp.]
MRKIVTFIMSMILAIGLFAAKPLKVGIVLSTGGLGDKSFNDAAYRGLEQAKKDLGIEFKYVEPASPAEDEEFLREYAEAGYDLIIATGFQMTESARAVAADYSDVKFLMIDDVVDLPNVKSLIFKEEEGSFLVGVIAGLMTKNNAVGFVGGMENPLIKKFEVGFKQGAEYVNPKVKFFSVYTTGPNPFNDPVRGKENAISEINQGADVIYHAAGGTGMGVFAAAKEKGVFAIGVDSNQDAVEPGTVLTSMLKNVDVAVYDSIKNLISGNFVPGVAVYGAQENGVGVTDFEFTKDIIGAEKLQKFEEIKAKLMSGEIKVSDK